MLIGTKEAARILGITPNTVVQYIYSGKIKAEKYAHDWILESSQLEKVTVRKPGRPREAKSAR